MNNAPLDHVDALHFALRWAENWNRRDLDAILTHYHHAVVFRSPVAASLIGTPQVQGSTSLRAYWEKALQTISDLHFEVVKVFYQPEDRDLIILYDARLSGSTKRVCERLIFDQSGTVIEAEALYGAVMDERNSDKTARGTA